MDDKRKIANEELAETINSGVLSFVTPGSPEFTNLPEMPQQMMAESGQNISNNFNINVNVSGNQNSSAINSAASSAIKNALPTLTGSTEEIKKNSSEVLRETSSQILKETEKETYREVLREIISPTNDYTNNTNVEIFENNSSVPILGMVGIGMPEMPDLANDVKSESIFNSNNTEVQNFQMLKNILNNTNVEMSDAENIYPYTSFDTSLYVDSDGSTTNYQSINNLMVHQNTENNLESANTLSRQSNYSIRHEELANKAETDFQNLRKMNDLGDEDKKEATPLFNAGLGNAQLTKKIEIPRKPSHVNGPLYEHPVFINQMNRPPVWRSVLG